jgi:hypothetical protein
VRTASAPAADPFDESVPVKLSLRLQLLGASILFESNSAQLLRSVKAAYAGLPPHRLPGSAPRLRIRLQLARAERGHRVRGPAPLQMVGGVGLLGAATGATNTIFLSPQQGAALLVVAPAMLRNPYHLRYEIIEFAVLTLITRVQSLMPLHAACFGLGDRGVLLMGDSGAGKSTLALHAIMRDWNFVCEDAAFVVPESLHATGAPNFLHLRAGTLRGLEQGSIATHARRSPVIRRRSGVRKLEVDLREVRCRAAPRPLQLDAAVFVTPYGAGRGPLLRPLPQKEWMKRLTTAQPYAANQPGWRTFTRSLSRIAVVELRRGRHPAEGLDALKALLRRGAAQRSQMG